MGVRILYDNRIETVVNHAALYCSTSDWAFGPVFYGDENHDADERAQLFLDWMKKHPYYRDVREYTDSELEKLYHEWLLQEGEQWAAIEQANERE